MGRIEIELEWVMNENTTTTAAAMLKSMMPCSGRSAERIRENARRKKGGEGCL